MIVSPIEARNLFEIDQKSSGFHTQKGKCVFPFFDVENLHYSYMVRVHVYIYIYIHIYIYIYIYMYVL